VSVALGCAIGLAVGAPSFAVASTPSAVALGAFSTGPTTATLEGEVNPAGETTYYQVAYDEPPPSAACRIGESVLGQMTSSELLGFTDEASHHVTISLGGFIQGAEYCVELVAKNSAGTKRSMQETFIAGAPKTLTVGADATGTTTATVESTVNPANQTTDYRIAYGPASSFWCKFGIQETPEHETSPEPLGFTDIAFHPVTAELSGLTPGTEYCAAPISENSSGIEIGVQETFTTTPVESLKISLAGTGSGTVTGSGISCPGSCWQHYVDGTPETLMATPAAGSTFTGWSGACTGSGACTVTLNAAQAVTATFTANPPPVATPLSSLLVSPSRLSLDGYAVSVRNSDKAAIKLTCSNTTTCSGKLTLTAKVPTREGKDEYSETEIIGTTSFSIPAGTAVTIRLKLNATGRRLLNAANRHIDAELTILKTTPRPSTTQTASVHLTLHNTKKSSTHTR
jgi:hypothetical protein